MSCDPGLIKNVPLFSLLDEEELAVLSSQVEQKTFAPRQRIYKIGDPAGQAYVVISGSVRVTTVDEEHQEVLLDQPGVGEFFGFASMFDQTAHQTSAHSNEETMCIEIDRHDIMVLLQRKPMAGMDLLTVLGRQFHAAQKLVQLRSMYNANVVIENEETVGERIADSVAHFGGSWAFIISFLLMLLVYTAINLALAGKAWDPYPFILLNLFLSMLAALQAPVIMMSQNRQDAKDRLRSELDFDINRRAESEIQGLSRKLNMMSDKLSDLEELIRSQRGSVGATS